MNKMAAGNEMNPKLEWMYKGTTDLLNRDEYLLGRTIDKNFEQLDSQEKKEHQEKLFGVQVPKNHVEYECIPFSIREYKNLQNNEQVDLQRKLMEDPLMAIKQKEMETRRKILENPVKLKELHKILKTEKSSLTAADKLKTKKVKKSKKTKKKEKQSGSDSSSTSENDSDLEDVDLDKLLAKKYKNIKNSLDDAIKKDLKLESLLKTINKTKKRKKSKKHNADSSSSSDSEMERSNKHRNYNKSSYEKKDDSKNRRNIKNQDEESDFSDNYSKKIENRNGDKYSRNYKNNGNYSPTEYKDRKNYYDTNRKNNKDYESDNKRFERNKSSSSEKESFKSRPNYKNDYERKTSYSKNSRKRSRSADRKDSSDKLYTKSSKSIRQNDVDKNKTSKLSEEDKAKRLKEMMENASKRNEERASKVNKYRKDCEEEEIAQRNRKYDDNFANKELKKVLTSNNTVESRIKSKINYIQRSATAMDSNFAKK